MTTDHPATRRTAVLLMAGALCVALVLAATPASAHVTANPGTAVAGEYTRIDLRVPHGCEGSPTTAVSVQIPDTIASVTPQFLPDWTVETVVGPLAEPVELHGETVTEGIREVTWSGGPAIPDDQFFDFGLSVRMPDAAGETLYLPVVQTCESGESSWIEIPEDGADAHELEHPAPAVVLTAAEDAGHAAPQTDDHASEAAMASEPVPTAELTTAGEPGPSTVSLIALIGGGLALLGGLAALVVSRRRSA